MRRTAPRLRASGTAKTTTSSRSFSSGSGGLRAPRATTRPTRASCRARPGLSRTRSWCTFPCRQPPAAAGVLRYRMDGYRVASVTPLSDRHQILTEQSVETTEEGSLIVRFKRPLVETFFVGRDACAATAVAVGEEGTGGLAVAAAGATAEVCAGEAGGSSTEWLDPRERGVVLLWAYGTGAWPSYHDATGAFVLPRMTAVEVD
ncbi:unnamed protein product [Ectocarpus sp. 13 AM-2016]